MRDLCIFPYRSGRCGVIFSVQKFQVSWWIFNEPHAYLRKRNTLYTMQVVIYLLMPVVGTVAP